MGFGQILTKPKLAFIPGMPTFQTDTQIDELDYKIFDIWINNAKLRINLKLQT